MSDVWHPIGARVKVEEFDGRTVPAYRMTEVLFFERWHWTPSVMDGMPISEREELRDTLERILAAEQRKVPTSPSSQSG